MQIRRAIGLCGLVLASVAVQAEAQTLVSEVSPLTERHRGVCFVAGPGRPADEAFDRLAALKRELDFPDAVRVAAKHRRPGGDPGDFRAGLVGGIGRGIGGDGPTGAAAGHTNGAEASRLDPEPQRWEMARQY